MSEHDIPVKEIGEMLEMVSNKLPKMLNEIMNSIYSEEAGSKMGKAVGSLYKELIEAGIPKEEALQMAKDYLIE